MKHRATEIVGLFVNALSIASFFFLVNILDVARVPPAMQYLGWFILALGLLLVALSILTLAANREGSLIERGIYGVVRHPMYAGAMLMFLSWSFFVPHWIMILISCVNVAIVYGFILQGEDQNITQFGDAYKRYMDTVPGINLLAGLVRFLRSK